MMALNAKPFQSFHPAPMPIVRLAGCATAGRFPSGSSVSPAAVSEASSMHTKATAVSV